MRARQAREAAPAPAPKRERPRAARPPRPAPARPSELERVETQVARCEEAIAELERRLAEDWTNADVLAEHRRARDELQALLERWETLFEAAK